MEKSLNSEIRKTFDLKKVDIRTYSPLSLAYIGDSIYDLIVRSVIVDSGNASVNNLHKKSTKYVSAKAQCAAVKEMFPLFTEEEKIIFRRGKNTKMNTFAKNASMSEYRNATGFEAVLGFLYLKEDMDRLFYLVKTAMDLRNKNER